LPPFVEAAERGGPNSENLVQYAGSEYQPVGFRSRLLRGGRKAADFDAVYLLQTIRIAGNVAPDRVGPLPQVCLDAAGRGAVKTTHPTIWS
jgi:hypothetical protein